MQSKGFVSAAGDIDQHKFSPGRRALRANA